MDIHSSAYRSNSGKRILLGIVGIRSLELILRVEGDQSEFVLRNSTNKLGSLAEGSVEDEDKSGESRDEKGKAEILRLGTTVPPLRNPYVRTRNK